MNTNTFMTECWLPERREPVFAFFADAMNLELITPPWLRFAVLTPPPIAMRAGALIDYRLRLHGVPLWWRTEITAWEPPFRFVDEQRRGPYRRWIHTHTFHECAGGTLCTDVVEYAVPGGELIHRLFVRRQVRAIFDFRRAALRRRFSAAANPPTDPVAAEVPLRTSPRRSVPTSSNHLPEPGR